MALIDKWQDPTIEELNKFLKHKMDGGVIAVRIGNLFKILTPIWPLEMAKIDLLMFNALKLNDMWKKYILTSLKITASALVQIWWAFETLLNDFAGIIYDQRKSNMSQIEALFLEEKNISLNKKGEIEERAMYQPIESRIQFIYNFLTNENIDRSSKDWNNIIKLKNARAAYVHRIGKEETKFSQIVNLDLIPDGFKSVQKIISDIFKKTPEFAERFVYKFLSFWSCENELPFLWDARCGNSIYLGLTNVKPESIIELYASNPRSFSVQDYKDLIDKKK